MLKRLVWWMGGALMGAGGTAWLQRRIKRTVAANPTVQTVTKLVAAPRQVSANVRDAVAEGREAAREREEELRDRYRLNR
jgi:hypothetical protein